MANEIEKYVQEKTSQKIYEVHQGDYNDLRQAALIFLQQVKKLSQLNHNIIGQDTIRKEIDAIYKNMRQAEKNTQKALSLQHIFEKQINDFMGRTIYLTYVNKQGGLYIYDDVNIGKLYSQATVNKGRGNISAEKMFDTIDIQGDLKEKILKSIQNRKDVFQKAVSRWQKNYQQDFDPSKTQTGKAYRPSKNTFYWRLHDYHISGWTDPITNRGWIAQGYAGAVINEENEINNAFIESSLQVLWTRYMKQDSLGGAIKGDIVLKNQTDIQFAIKSGSSFSTAKFGQFVRLAYNIIQIKLLTPSQFEAVLPKLVNFSKVTDKIIEGANTKGEKEITFEIKKQKTTVTLGINFDID